MEIVDPSELGQATGAPLRTGFDQIEFLFAPNPGEPFKPLKSIASSGEMARVMLALKTVLASQDSIPILIFDEVDANVGGETAAVVGQKMKQIGEKRQVLCITHLAPVAAAGAAHYLVEKEVADGRKGKQCEVDELIWMDLDFNPATIPKRVPRGHNGVTNDSEGRKEGGRRSEEGGRRNETGGARKGLEGRRKHEAKKRKKSSDPNQQMHTSGRAHIPIDGLWSRDPSHIDTIKRVQSCPTALHQAPASDAFEIEHVAIRIPHHEVEVSIAIPIDWVGAFSSMIAV